MKEPANFRWSDMHDLFSVIMCIDESMAIVYASETLASFMPQTLKKPKLLEVFDAQRPSALGSFSDGLSKLGSLCLLTAKDGKFAIRGQLLKVDYEGRQVLCFCGAPWLFWINTKVPDTALGLGDFSAQDVQLDQLFFMSTEKKMVEDLERLNADLQLAKLQLEEAQGVQRQFFAQMSHEIRTPLNGVVSALSLLQQINQDAGQTRVLELAQSSSENLMQVINDVLSTSKLESGEQQEEVVFSWPDLIRNTVDVVEAKARQKELPIWLEFSPQFPVACYGAPDQLRQTLLNLLMNAIKFTLKGKIVVRASVVERAAQLCTLRLEVVDTGVGIPANQLDKVFEPFWSAASTEAGQESEGTGLGLDIVRRNVRSMGGEVRVQSAPGEGATFSFDLQVRLPLNPVDALAVDVVDVKATPTLVGHVLLVDDNQTNRILGAFVLESLGLVVTAVDCGIAAVKAVREGRFDLVLMDINMPDMDGLTATRQIRQFISGDQLPIVALTAFTDVHEKAACLESGMADYLTKPMVRDQLAKALSNWLACTTEQPDNEETGQNHGVGIRRPDSRLIEPKVLLEMVKQIGRENVYLVVAKVKEEALQRWQQLEQAESAADTDALRLHVHSLRSIFSSVGLIAISELLVEIETALRAGGALGPRWLQDMQQLKTDSLVALDAAVASI
jgi:signal transduction histidine kinase/DNA-binding response OmpR family regulator